MINGINRLAPIYIKWPEGDTSGFKKFRKCIGCIDGTYVPCACPIDQMKAYTNRKCFTSITLQAICDKDMRYIHVYAGWPSSVPDVRIFKNSDIYNLANQNPSKYFPNGTYILGDKAYPVLSWCIPPFIQHKKLTPNEIKFNTIHASERQIIERSFALLFGRFRRLRYLDMKRIDWAPQTIIAACVLHNFGLNYDDDVESFIQEGFEARRGFCDDDGDSFNDTISDENIDASKNIGVVKRQELLKLLT